MTRRRLYHEYAIDYTSHTPDLDFSRLPLCECGASLLEWMSVRFPDVLTAEKPQVLDLAIQALTKEYIARKGVYPEHPLNSCLSEIFNELLVLLRTKRDELARHDTSLQDMPTAQIYIGEDEEVS